VTVLSIAGRWIVRNIVLLLFVRVALNMGTTGPGAEDGKSHGPTRNFGAGWPLIPGAHGQIPMLVEGSRIKEAAGKDGASGEAYIRRNLIEGWRE
jgi:hypothetical protein